MITHKIMKGCHLFPETNNRVKQTSLAGNCIPKEQMITQMRQSLSPVSFQNVALQMNRVLKRCLPSALLIFYFYLFLNFFQIWRKHFTEQKKRAGVFQQCLLLVKQQPLCTNWKLVEIALSFKCQNNRYLIKFIDKTASKNCKQTIVQSKKIFGTPYVLTEFVLTINPMQQALKAI